MLGKTDLGDLSTLENPEAFDEIARTQQNLASSSRS